MAKIKSNRAVGNSFEQELCDKLFDYGFWAHNLTQNRAGQPADVIAAKDGTAVLIDCKDCEQNKFDLKRVEDNQITAMRLWEECGNDQGWFAIKINDEIYMTSYTIVMLFKSRQSTMSLDDILRSSSPLREWVKRW